jgi:hypothetical protein
VNFDVVACGVASIDARLAVAIVHLLFAQVVCSGRGHSRINFVEIPNDFAESRGQEFWDSRAFWGSSGTVMRRDFTRALEC